jgi:FkbM family methyltransferase
MLKKTIISTRAKLEKSARDLLYGTAVFFPLRSGYQFLFNREKLAGRRKMRQFYANFVQRGDLVFDVGANMGLYSEVFSQLGAKVVAVEPNPRCCQNLNRLARNREVHVQNCAAGDLPGRAMLHVCEDPVLSTLTDHFFEAAQRSLHNCNAKWLGTLEVEVITLDQLAARFGVPSFVKIDAEGYDDHVLRGMSFRPSALSFEFSREVPQVALRCLETPALAHGYLFNYVRGMEMRFACESWMRAEELYEQLDTLAGEWEYGDVLARRIS